MAFSPAVQVNFTRTADVGFQVAGRQISDLNSARTANGHIQKAGLDLLRFDATRARYGQAGEIINSHIEDKFSGREAGKPVLEAEFERPALDLYLETFHDIVVCLNRQGLAPALRDDHFTHAAQVNAVKAADLPRFADQITRSADGYGVACSGNGHSHKQQQNDGNPGLVHLIPSNPVAVEQRVQFYEAFYGIGKRL